MGLKIVRSKTTIILAPSVIFCLVSCVPRSNVQTGGSSYRGPRGLRRIRSLGSSWNLSWAGRSSNWNMNSSAIQFDDRPNYLIPRRLDRTCLVQRRSCSANAVKLEHVRRSWFPTKLPLIESSRRSVRMFEH